VSRWPELVGLDGVRASRTFELLPYVTSKGEFVNRAPEDPFHDGEKVIPDAGFDLRTSLGSRLTLNATINPDFGQVEVDPASVNLSDVETFFQEKRPFFVEGSSNFRFGNEGASDYWNFGWPEPMFFYSRRVGRAPQGGLPVADFADVPLGTTILGAAKLTGKITPSTNFGTMHALTARERAKLDLGGTRWEQEVEPLTYYGVSRALREFKDRRHGIGAMASVVQRQFDDASLEDQLNRGTYVGAVDGWTSFGPERLWVLSGWAAATNVTGTRARILDLQQSSRRYYQRPDAGHLDLDPDATSLRGAGARVWLNKERGKWFSNSGVGFMTPGFELNDIGFQSRSDIVNGHTVFGHRWSKPGKVKQFARADMSLYGSTDFGGNVTSRGMWHGGFVEFLNRAGVNWWSSYNTEVTAVRLTRGGPRMKAPPNGEAGFYAYTNGTRKVVYEFQLNWNGSEDGGHFFNTNPGVEWKPASNVRLGVGPGFSKGVENAQYVETYADPAAVDTYGNRYLFARLDLTEVSANIRLTWAFTPTMSLQTYVQPYISAGKYTDFKALARPNSYDFVAAPATYDPDFNFKSLRGNAVFRWEYMPGSTLFLVWTQQRIDFVQDGSFDFNRDAKALFDRDSDNIFLAKLTYYFTL